MAWSKQKYRRSAGTFKRWSSATVKPSYKHNKGARTEAIRASILAEEKLGGLGATVQYRKHLRDGTPGLMDKRGNFVH